MKNQPPIQILIADDHSIVREGLAAVFHREQDLRLVAEARNWTEAVSRAVERRPEVAVLDLHMAGTFSAFEGIAIIREKSPETRIIIYSAFSTDEEVYQVFHAGAQGYVLKGESGRDDLLVCIRAVHRGEIWIHPVAAARLAGRMTAATLTQRETDVLRLMAYGKSNKEIGSSLDVTAGTVKVHVNHILSKLGVAGRVEAISVGLRRGLLRITGKDATPEPCHRNGQRGNAGGSLEDISKRVDPPKPPRQLRPKK
jgi:DNA-binding NarL/FixJ family response regulator